MLRLLARGLNKAELAAPLTLSEATVKTHLAQIPTKPPARRNARPEPTREWRTHQAGWFQPARRHRATAAGVARAEAIGSWPRSAVSVLGRLMLIAGGKDELLAG